VFRLHEVTVRYGKEVALDQLSIAFQPGKMYGVIGPDGAGKTTLIKCLMGLIQPQHGKIERTNSERIGYASEQFGLYEDLSIRENLEFYGSLYGLDKEVIWNRSKPWLERSGLAPFADRLAGNLSGGMKRKLSIIVSLLPHPSWLILDEPTHGVDPVSRREIWKLIKEIHAQGAGMIISTQYLDEISFCDEVLFLHKGKVLCQETPANLVQQFPYDVYALPKQEPFANPEHAVRQLIRGAKRMIWMKKGKAPGGKWERISPSFEDVFIHLLDQAGENS
jgi:ABC-2 type transport system ATP-binding protein